VQKISDETHAINAETVGPAQATPVILWDTRFHGRLSRRGIDVIVDADGEPIVLEDNVRTPSGISYVIENRDVLKLTFPKLFAGYRIEPVDDYPLRLLRTLREAADEWLARYPDDASVMAYIGRFGRNTVRIDGVVPDEELYELVDASYDDVVAGLPKSKRPA